MINIQDKKVINKIIDWANQRTDIRPLIMTSHRANPYSTIDEFTDYDVIVVVEDIKPYMENVMVSVGFSCPPRDVRP